MYKIILSLVMIPSILFSQYFGERSNEKNFETSDFFFRSVYLNPYGLKNFKEITPALIEHPFLNLQLNPAYITRNENDLIFYFDFRTENNFRPEILDYPVVYPLESFIVPDERIIPPIYISETRKEPEPKFSFGLITKPLKSILPNLFLGGTFQRISKSEKFYSTPYWIYYPRFAMDPFGNRIGYEGSYPVIDRYSGRDDMTTTANFYSVFTGYQINEKLSFGISYSGIDHLRIGGLMDEFNDEFGNIDNIISNRLISHSRFRDYYHDDFSAGLIYKFNDDLLTGIKVGYLRGKAIQHYSYNTSYFHQYDIPDVSSTWNMSSYQSLTDQNWENTGNVNYFNFNFEKKINSSLRLIVYFTYNTSRIDFTNNSDLFDSSYYNYKWSYQNYQTTYYYKVNSGYKMKDLRTGSGFKDKKYYSGFVGARIDISSSVKMTLGLSYFENRYKVNSVEPVIFESITNYSSTTTDTTYNPPVRNSYLRIYEDKELKWNYESIDFSYQIPVMLNFILIQKIQLMILINQISYGFQIEEKSDVFFRTRIRTENDTTKITHNFIERYTSPPSKQTRERTDLIANLTISPSKNINIGFIFNPELLPFLNLSEWWFKIEGSF